MRRVLQMGGEDGGKLTGGDAEKKTMRRVLQMGGEDGGELTGGYVILDEEA